MGGQSSRLLLGSSLVYLPAVLAQVTRLKRGKKEREEKKLVGHTANLAVHAHAQTHTHN